MKPRFNVGDRVKIRIAKDVIPESEIKNDTGYVKGVDLFFYGTERERIVYWVCLDGIYTERKYIGEIGPLVSVGEGWNIAQELCSIEAE